MDYISLSRGGKFDDAKQPAVGQVAYPYTGPSGYECMPSVISDPFGPFGRNLEAIQFFHREGFRLLGRLELSLVLAPTSSNFERETQVHGLRFAF